MRFNAFFFKNCVSAILVASEDIAEQINMLAGDGKLHVATFLPTYSASQFSSVRPANLDAHPFRIMFAGRIEANKGIYDLLNVAQRLERSESRRFHIDVCGEGQELEALRKRIATLNLEAIVSCHGFCARPTFSSILGQAHVVIVPTTTQFEEGFAMICAESILADRPVITSSVCPALRNIREAAIEVPPNDVEAYVQAILDLCHDHELYERKRLACKALQKQFYDENNSWGAKLRLLLTKELCTIEGAYTIAKGLRKCP